MSKNTYSNEIKEKANLQLAGELLSRPPFQIPPAFKDRNSRTCRIISKQGLV